MMKFIRREGSEHAVYRNIQCNQLKKSYTNEIAILPAEGKTACTICFCRVSPAADGDSSYKYSTDVSQKLRILRFCARRIYCVELANVRRIVGRRAQN